MFINMKRVSFQATVPRHRSFWLRCWQICNQQGCSSDDWRFSLEDPQSGLKIGFTDMQSIITFLALELGIEAHEIVNAED